MPFVRAEWLLEHDLAELPRMQDLPRHAFLSAAEMDYCYFISHRWLGRDHPDVTGRQLAVALPAVWIDSSRRSLGSGRKNTGVWYDFLCMPQPPRSEQEDRLFDSLLLQHTGLTLCTIPILVVDDDVDYATRAWCVAELLGVHRSGFSGKSVSLAMHMLKYPYVLSHGESPWNPSVDADDGFRPGLSKLQSWLEKNDMGVSCSKTEVEGGWRQHKVCMHAANKVFWDFSIAKQKGYRLSDDALLLAIAERNRLECTRANDVPICMRIMVSVLRAFD